MRVHFNYLKYQVTLEFNQSLCNPVQLLS